MILNTRIWNETVNAAKAAASTSPAWLRAIERAVIEIERSRYWSFDGDVLAIISTTSKKTYKIGADHTCEACANGHTACKHRAARRLMVRYTERLQTAAPKLAKLMSDRAAEDRRREELIEGIESEWRRRHPHSP
ncbi:MAG: hypothetical protein ACRD9Y_28210, partial [Blastocatellia bacterium]